MFYKFNNNINSIVCKFHFFHCNRWAVVDVFFCVDKKTSFNFSGRLCFLIPAYPLEGFSGAMLNRKSAEKRRRAQRLRREIAIKQIKNKKSAL